MNNKMLLTVVMPVFNASKTIERAIKSVLYQTYENIELIIIDGGSTDETVSIVEKYRESIAYFISEKDNGYSDALNKGIKQAKGEYSIILAADDFFLPNAMERFIETVKTDTDVWCGNMLVLKESGVITRFKRANSLEELKKGYYFAHPATFFRIDAFKKYGLYNTEYKINADAELLLRFGNSGAIFQIVDEYITVFVCGGMSVKEDLGESVKDLLVKSDVEKVTIQHGGSPTDARILRVKRLFKKKLAYLLKKISGNHMIRLLYQLDGQKPLTDKEKRELGIPENFLKI